LVFAIPGLEGETWGTRPETPIRVVLSELFGELDWA